jgi:hypothetical protein
VFVHFMLSCRRMAQVEQLYQEFNARLGDSVRDCRLQGERSRDLELLFKAEDYRPTVAFIWDVLTKYEFARGPAEFAYDDGSFNILFVHEDKVVVDDDRDHGSEMVFLPVLTGIRDDTERAIGEWAAEIGASQGGIEAKRERIAAGKKAWDDRMERDRVRLEKRERVKGAQTAPGPGEAGNVRTKVRYSLPPNLSKGRVLEIIQKLNTSGEVLIPVFILKDEIDTKLSKDEMIQLHLDFERSGRKAEMFSLVSIAVEQLRHE